MLTRRYSRLQGGLTLMELIVVVAIAAIIMMIGVPSLGSWFVSAQVTAKSEATLNGLQLARTEALRRNTRVFFLVASDSSWSVGCVSVVGDLDGDSLDDCPAVIQSKPAGEAGSVDSMTLLPFGASMVTFNGIGAVTANSDGSQTLTEIHISKSGGAVSRTLNVLITLGGQSRICDPEIETAGDPRTC